MTHVDLERAIVRKAHLLALVLATTGSAFAINWNNSAGGVLTDDGNWKGGVAPTATQDAAFENSVNAPVTMSDDVPAKTNAVITINGNNLPLEFAFGKGHEYYASTRVSFAFGRRLTLSSGRLGGKTLYAPNQTGATLTPLRITVDGEDAELFGSFQFGAKGPSGNSLVLRNGGRYSGGLSVGVQSAACSGNRIVVTDPGSVLAATTLNLGQTAGDNVIVVSNSATMAVSTALYIGTVNSGSATSSNNVLGVVDGGRATLPCKIYVGERNGACSNRIEVLSGGVLDMSGGSPSIGSASGEGNAIVVDGGTVISSNATSKTITVGGYGRGSRIDLRNGAVFAASNLLFTVGDTGAAAKNSGIRIAGGSWMTIANKSSTYCYYASKATGCFLELDNGVLEIPNSILRGGADLTPSNCFVRVVNGSKLRTARIIMGDHAEGHELIVENSAIVVSGDLSFASSHIAGTDPDLRHDYLRIGGSNTTVTVGGSVSLNRDTTATFAIPKEGYSAVPVSANGLGLGSRSRVVVNVDDRYIDGGRIVLMKSKNKITDNGATFETNFGRFDNTDYEIAVKVPGRKGLMVLLK